MNEYTFYKFPLCLLIHLFIGSVWFQIEDLDFASVVLTIQCIQYVRHMSIFILICYFL
jgi:hypothetical protein